MNSIINTMQTKRAAFFSNPSLPLSQADPSSHDPSQPGQLRRRLSSLSLKIQPLVYSSASTASSWSPLLLRRSKSVSAIGSSAGSSIRKWWEWGWSWILSRKPVFANDLEMNEDETRVLGSQSRGSWRHVFYKVRSEIRRLVRSDDRVGLPQTCSYSSFDYANNFDKGQGRIGVAGY